LPTNQRIGLGEQPVVIGRAPECNIQLHDTNVSRRHAEIVPRGTGYALVDLNSTNGVRVNGLRVAEQVLIDGDEILVGNTRMIFEAS
jgi:pSer/pThr/pTyr-binding forkhead associated (FHA) protein